MVHLRSGERFFIRLICAFVHRIVFLFPLSGFSDIVKIPVISPNNGCGATAGICNNILHNCCKKKKVYYIMCTTGNIINWKVPMANTFAEKIYSNLPCGYKLSFSTNNLRFCVIYWLTLCLAGKQQRKIMSICYIRHKAFNRTPIRTYTLHL